jgi:hypothetical protein
MENLYEKKSALRNSAVTQNKLIYFRERLRGEFDHSLSSGAEDENETVCIYIYICL